MRSNRICIGDSPADAAASVEFWNICNQIITLVLNPEEAQSNKITNLTCEAATLLEQQFISQTWL